MADRLSPSDIPLPSSQPAQGPRARPSAIVAPRINDQRGQAYGALASSTLGLARAREELGQAQGNIGGSVAEFGNAIGNIGSAFATLARSREKANDDAFLNRFDLRAAQEDMPIIQDAVSNPGSGAEFVQGLDQKLADNHARIRKELEGELGYAPTTAGEQQLQNRSYSLRTSAAREAAVAATNQGVANIADNASTTVDGWARMAYGDGNLDQGLARVDQTAESLKTVLPQDKFNAWREAARSKVYSAVVLGHKERADRYLAAGNADAARAELDAMQKITDGLTGASAVPKQPKGQVEPGNLDPFDRPLVPRQDGEPGFHTALTFSIGTDKGEVLIPQVYDGKVHTQEEAVQHYYQTGQHFGIFASPEDADRYSQQLHEAQVNFVKASFQHPQVVSAIIAEAKKEGVDPVVALAIARHESKFDVGAKNPDSTAAGVFQTVADTGRAYGLPADARSAPMQAQVSAGVALTADNIEKLTRAIGSDPTPGEVYLAHFLGPDGAIRVIHADPNAPLKGLISDAAISANHLTGKTAGDLRSWAQSLMQANMEAVVEGGLVQRDLGGNEAGLPLADTVKLSAQSAEVRNKIAAYEEKRVKEFIAAVDPSKPRAARDPAGFVTTHVPDVQGAFGYAQNLMGDQNATPQDKTAAWSRALEGSLAEQKALGVPDPKLLPNDLSKSIVNDLTESKTGQEIVGKFASYRELFGAYWPQVYGELVDQKLPASYQIFGFVDGRDPGQMNAVAQILNVKQEELDKNLGSAGAGVTKGLLQPLEDDMAPFMQAFEFGNVTPATRAQSAGMMQALKMIALNQYRQNGGDAAGAKEYAKRIILDHLDVIGDSNVHALVPKELGLTPAEVSAAASQIQTRKDIESFDPIAIKGNIPGGNDKFWRERTISTAANFGVWTTNEKGDGLVLMVPLGDGSSYVRLLNKQGKAYELKFADVSSTLAKGIMFPGLVNPL